MPSSKHRRKPGAKSIRHPGNGRHLRKMRAALERWRAETLDQFFARNPDAISSLDKLRTRLADPALSFVDRMRLADAWQPDKDDRPYKTDDEMVARLCQDLDAHERGEEMGGRAAEVWQSEQLYKLLRTYCVGSFLDAWVEATNCVIPPDTLILEA